MNEWMETFISQCLADIPWGKYCQRTAKELRDHMETQYQALIGAGASPSEARGRVLAAMGDPERLREEYRAGYEAAWERSLPGRLEELRHCLKMWAGGCAVMAGVHLLISYVSGSIWQMALSLPGNSPDPQIRMIRDTLGNLNNSLFWRHLFPLVCALLAGAYYLGRRFQTSRRPARRISTGLFFHWAYIAAFRAWWRTIDSHYLSFWEAVGRHFYYNAGYYALTLAFCVLLGVVFGLLYGQKTERGRELA